MRVVLRITNERLISYVIVGQLILATGSQHVLLIDQGKLVEVFLRVPGLMLLPLGISRRLQVGVGEVDARVPRRRVLLEVLELDDLALALGLGRQFQRIQLTRFLQRSADRFIGR